MSVRDDNKEVVFETIKTYCGRNYVSDDFQNAVTGDERYKALIREIMHDTGLSGPSVRRSVSAIHLEFKTRRQRERLLEAMLREDEEESSH